MSPLPCPRCPRCPQRGRTMDNKNDYYDHGGISSMDFIEQVCAYLSDIPYAIPSVSIALKYPLRAGAKPDTYWKDDAYKCANYLCRAITGRFIPDYHDYLDRLDRETAELDELLDAISEGGE